MYDARSKQDSNAIEIGHDVPASHHLSPGQGEQMLHDGAIASIILFLLASVVGWISDFTGGRFPRLSNDSGYWEPVNSGHCQRDSVAVEDGEY